MTDERVPEVEVPLAPGEADPRAPYESVAWAVPPGRPKFQHKWRRHIVLFALTFFTTTFPQEIVVTLLAPVAWVIGLRAGEPLFNPLALYTWDAFTNGLWYSLPLLTILSAHEFGHYFACRYYDVDASLPYFIPAPIQLTGTLGAVIRIREAFPSKRALFDIGVAGPIAGFLALVPFLLWGMWLSEHGPSPAEPGNLYFGEPLLWKLVEWARFGVQPEGWDVFLHPMTLAAWVGMLATALNLLPFGQLDGGHLTYAAFGPRASRISIATLVVVAMLTVQSVSWLVFGLMLTAMAFFFGFRHPRVIDEDEPLDSRRRLIAVAAFVIFVICFTPVPIEVIGE